MAFGDDSANLGRGEDGRAHNRSQALSAGGTDPGVGRGDASLNLRSNDGDGEWLRSDEDRGPVEEGEWQVGSLRPVEEKHSEDERGCVPESSGVSAGSG